MSAQRGTTYLIRSAEGKPSRHAANLDDPERERIRETARARFNNDLRYRAADHPSQTQLTPEYVLCHVRDAFDGRIGLDPCTIPENPCDAEAFYAPPVDGLAESWDFDRIFVNPPYGKVREPWVERCIHAGLGGRRVILLMPAATDTRTFQAAASSATCVLYVKGRLKFGVLRPNRRQVAASHPSALIGWNVSLVVPELGMTSVQGESTQEGREQ